MTTKAASNIVLGIGMMLVALEIYQTKQSVTAAKELDESPLTYSEWTPDKKSYKPGDLISFSYTREVKPQKEPLLLVMVESFQNQDTGEVFLGTRIAKRLRESGKEELKGARRIPLDCTPGRYVMEGLASAQSTRLAKAVGYSSNEFRIEAK